MKLITLDSALKALQHLSAKASPEQLKQAQEMLSAPISSQLDEPFMLVLRDAEGREQDFWQLPTHFACDPEVLAEEMQGLCQRAYEKGREGELDALKMYAQERGHLKQGKDLSRCPTRSR